MRVPWVTATPGAHGLQRPVVSNAAGASHDVAVGALCPPAQVGSKKYNKVKMNKK